MNPHKQLIVVLVIAALLAPGTYAAYHGPQGMTDGEQMRDEPDRDREQDGLQDRIRDPSTHDGDEPDQERQQERDRLQAQNRSIPQADPMGRLNESQQQFMAQQQERLRERCEQAVCQLINLTTAPGLQAQQRFELVSAAMIANESNQAQSMLEARLENRNALQTFFAGGDHDTAAAMLREVQRMREQIRALEAVEQDCTQCNATTRAQLQEQIRTLANEQARREQLAQRHLQRRGLVGWIWK